MRDSDFFSKALESIASAVQMISGPPKTISGSYQPSSATAGGGLPLMQVNVADAAGNPFSTFGAVNGQLVQPDSDVAPVEATATIYSSDGNSVVLGTVPVVNGKATFSSLSVPVGMGNTSCYIVVTVGNETWRSSTFSISASMVRPL